MEFREALRNLVVRKFTQARSNKDLVFSDTRLALLQQPSTPPIQLRYCPALDKKPASNAASQASEKPKKTFDPFESPVPELLIAQIPDTNPSHNLVLNKYPVIFNHFILATKENKPQTDVLEEDDLYLTYNSLQAWKQDAIGRKGHSLFAFFNSGEHSGASQPHRHLQFLPVENMKGEENGDWRLLCETMILPAHKSLPLLHNPKLTFVHFATSLRSGLGAADLHQRYLLLMRAALASITEGTDLESLNAVSISHDGRTTFSYNLAVTTEVMAILPRRAETSAIPGVANSSIAINGTILAGTMMVKAEEEWHSLCEQPQYVQNILNDITFPRMHDVLSDERHMRGVSQAEQ